MKPSTFKWPIAKRLLIAVSFVAVTSYANAQFDDPGDLPMDPDDANLPVDGGLTIVMAAAVGYISRKQHDKKLSESMPWCPSYIE